MAQALTAGRLFLFGEPASTLWSTGPGAIHRDLRWASGAPDGPLRRVVDLVSAGTEDAGEGVEERLLPDGRVHVVFVLAPEPSAVVTGGTCTARLLHLRGRVETITLRLRPGGVRALLDVPARALVDRAIPLTELWGASAESLLAGLLECSPPQRAPFLVRQLQAMLEARTRFTDPRAERAVAELGRDPGRTPEALAGAVGVGVRRLQQLFAAEVGLPVRQLRRVIRVHRALEQLRAGRSGVEAALGCGFVDESHLVHELRSATGVTPGALRDFASVQLGPIGGG